MQAGRRPPTKAVVCGSRDELGAALRAHFLLAHARVGLQAGGQGHRGMLAVQRRRPARPQLRRCAAAGTVRAEVRCGELKQPSTEGGGSRANRLSTSKERPNMGGLTPAFGSRDDTPMDSDMQAWPAPACLRDEAAAAVHNAGLAVQAGRQRPGATHGGAHIPASAPGKQNDQGQAWRPTHLAAEAAAAAAVHTASCAPCSRWERGHAARLACITSLTPC